MNPKTITQKHIVQLSGNLGLIPMEAIKWGKNKMDRYYHVSRGVTYCLECGHNWKDESQLLTSIDKKCKCPNCGERLHKIKYYRANTLVREYMAVLEVVYDMQVVRIVCLNKWVKMKEAASYDSKAYEVIQHWIGPKMIKSVTLSMGANGMSSVCDQWVWHTTLQVRAFNSYSSQYRRDISPSFTYPKGEIHPLYKRNGFTGEFYDCSPREFLRCLQWDSRMETVLKAKQYNLVRVCVNSDGLHRNWNSIKICLRNKYKINNFQMWSDYIRLLEYFHKDLRNAKYVCPRNLKKEHDRLVEKKRKIQEAEAAERKRKRVADYEQQFAELKGHLLGLCIVGEGITVKTLDSVNEYMKEGDTLHHCVYTNEYFLQKDSLCLSARIDEKPVETIEVNLKEMKVAQCRGLYNQPSPYHDQILNLIDQNINLIAKRAAI